MKQFELEISGTTHKVEIAPDHQSAIIDGRTVEFRILSDEDERILIRLGTKVYKVTNSSTNGSNISFLLDGNPVELAVKDEKQLLLEKLGFNAQSTAVEGVVNAPMPGKILEILVSEGEQVSAGASLLVLEAMKMENELKSPVDGIVKSLHVTKNESVEKNQKLLEIEIIG